MSNRPAWQAGFGDAYAITHAQIAENIFHFAIEPSCKAISSELALAVECEGVEKRDNLRRTQLELHRSFALTLGGLFERNLQRLLLHSVHLTAETKWTRVERQILSGSWQGLSSAFEQIRGFPLEDFSSYQELYLLHRVTSAVRHGDGSSAEKVWELEPSLFLKDVEPTNWHSFFTFGGDGEAAVSKMEIPFDRLVSFKNAVVEFWTEIDEMRTNSSATST
jgi:hypothetical protein